MDNLTTQTLRKTRKYQFQFLPLEGPLPGKYFEQQTEDAINDLGEHIITVEETANNAYQSAVTANNKAEAAQQTADAAQTTANKALDIANSALEQAGTAGHDAATAMRAAQAAQQTADTAVINAAAAQRTADKAVSDAAAAQKTANTAVNNAATAQGTADSALQAANTAQQAANTAQSAANNAATNASAAQSAADAAQNAANSASSLAQQNSDEIVEMKYYSTPTGTADASSYTEYINIYIPSGGQNAPTTNGGFLEVATDKDNADDHIIQTFTDQTTGEIYHRFGVVTENASGEEVTTWTAWEGVTNDVQTALNNHVTNYNNPHKVTAAQLGLASAYKYKGSVAKYSNLPTNAAAGDVYNVETADKTHNIKAGDNVAWTGTVWDVLSGTFDTSELAAAIARAQTTANNALPKSGGTVTGIVNFNVSPKVPTAEQTVNDTTAASTAFVKMAIQNSSLILNGYSHNGIYGGRNLGVTITSEAEMTAFLNEHDVSSGAFTGLYVGDYFTILDGVYNKKWCIAGFDIEYRKGLINILQKHHLALLPINDLISTSMNNTDTTVGGYQGSKMFTETIPTIVSNLTNALGAHLLEREALLTNSVNAAAASAAGAGWTGSSNNWSWVLQKATLMSEVQVYGGTVFSSSGYDTGEANLQLPIFRFTNLFLIQRLGTWLRCVASGSRFCYAGGYGYASTSSAAYAGHSVRPLICVG